MNEGKWQGHGNVLVRCDRCGGFVEGYADEHATSGFYYVGPHNNRYHPWASYLRPEEHFLCDFCMFSDPRYQTEYGVHSAGEAPPYVFDSPDDIRVIDVEGMEALLGRNPRRPQ